MKTVTEKIGYWIDEAIVQHGQGETILWEHTLLPEPQSGSPLYTVFIWFPGAMVGTTINASFQIPDVLGITKGDIDQIVSGGLEELRRARSTMLAQNSPEGAETAAMPPRGAQTASGLLIP